MHPHPGYKGYLFVLAKDIYWVNIGWSIFTSGDDTSENKITGVHEWKINTTEHEEKQHFFLIFIWEFIVISFIAGLVEADYYSVANWDDDDFSIPNKQINDIIAVFMMIKI